MGSNASRHKMTKSRHVPNSKSATNLMSFDRGPNYQHNVQSNDTNNACSECDNRVSITFSLINIINVNFILN